MVNCLLLDQWTVENLVHSDHLVIVLCYSVYCTGAGSGLSNSAPYKVHHITKFYEPLDLNTTLPTPEIGCVSKTGANDVVLLYCPV